MDTCSTLPAVRSRRNFCGYLPLIAHRCKCCENGASANYSNRTNFVRFENHLFLYLDGFVIMRHWWTVNGAISLNSFFILLKYRVFRSHEVWMHVLWPKADIDFRAITTGKVDNRRGQGPREQVGFRSLSSLIVYKQVVNSSIHNCAWILQFAFYFSSIQTPTCSFINTLWLFCIDIC